MAVYRLILFLSLVILSCSGDAVEDKVISKLKHDKNSTEVYKSLCEKFSKDSDSSYNLYLSLYNKGVPLVRLFEYDTIIKSFENKNCNNDELSNCYKNLIMVEKNYINDERRATYFQVFLEDYYIIPTTH